MNQYLLIIIIIAYLAALFVLAFWAEKNHRAKWVTHPWVYTLSLAVYCSAWTYYGSVGLASKSNLDFLPIYLGPVVAMPLWILITKKVIYLSKSNNISSIADFISLRYGNNRSLGAMVTILCIFAILPYIALQLKAVSESFSIVTNKPVSHSSIFTDYTFFIALILALFAAFFGTLSSDASDKKSGVIFSVAVESMLKLFFFVIIGIYVVYYLFDGTTDIYQQIAATNPDLLTPIFNVNDGGMNWAFMIALSFMAMFLLPRQFQVGVVEYTNRLQMKSAIWGFPLYLFLFNIFVLFIAWAGVILFQDTVNPDYYMLHIPMMNDNKWITTLVFFGGFSAVISMVVVSSIALATMLSNNVIIPYGYLDRFIKNPSAKNSNKIKTIRRVTIILLIIAAYYIYINLNTEVSLISLGLVSFVIIAQLAPSFFIGLYWTRGSSLGAKAGILTGFFIVAFTLLIPFFLESTHQKSSIELGYFGWSFLKPYQLFGLKNLTPVNHAFFWSLLANTFAYLVVSVSFKGNYRERNYGEIFVNAQQLSTLQENAFVWKGEAYYDDIEELLHKFLGNERAQRAISIFKRKYNVPANETLADARFINFSEKLLTGTIGSASAKIMIASVVKEKPVTLPEVLNILEENKETRHANKLLTQQSTQLQKLTQELQSANSELIKQDQQKDSFLDTVAHELKTPITAIQAASEVLQDQDMPQALREQFLENIMNDTNRLTKLINNILDLEKLSSGRENLNIQPNNFVHTVTKAIKTIALLAKKQQTTIVFDTKNEYILPYDEDKIMQVLTNVISNALKFVPKIDGKINIALSQNSTTFFCTIIDNGKGIDPDDLPYIFDKFYQSKNQQLQKPSGSGFGLAICQQIINLHNGKIYAQNNVQNGATFTIELPLKLAL